MVVHGSPCRKAFLLIILVSLLASCDVGQHGDREKSDAAGKNEPTLAHTGEKEPPPVSYVVTTDKDGKKVWIAKVSPSTYRIPDVYMGTATDVGFWLRMHWPSGRPAREIPQAEWSSLDQLNVLIKPESASSRRTAEVVRAELQNRFPKHTLKPHPDIPDALQIIDSTGKPTYFVLTNRDDVKMPNGEPYFFNTALGNCRTIIGLPDGNSLIVDFRVKHVADWYLIFPEVLRRVEGMREK